MARLATTSTPTCAHPGEELVRLEPLEHGLHHQVLDGRADTARVQMAVEFDLRRGGCSPGVERHEGARACLQLRVLNRQDLGLAVARHAQQALLHRRRLSRLSGRRCVLGRLEGTSQLLVGVHAAVLWVGGLWVSVGVWGGGRMRVRRLASVGARQYKAGGECEPTNKLKAGAHHRDNTTNKSASRLQTKHTTAKVDLAAARDLSEPPP
jgi:hypothetical protein